MLINVLRRKMSPKILILVFIAIAIGLSYCYSGLPILAEEDVESAKIAGDSRKPNDESSILQKEGWSVIKSNYFTIFYKPDVNLSTLEKRLRFKGELFSFGGSRSLKANNVKEKIAYNMDSLFKKVKEILGMYPRVYNIKMKVFKNQRELDEEHYRLLGKRESLRSFYIYKFNTIYTSESGISDYVMAHEMGHAVVDHYFVVRPPDEIKEVLSAYVESHLH